VYLPPCYDKTTDTYPLLTLLHGSNSDDGQWARLGFLDELDDAIASGQAPPMIVVSLFGEYVANENMFDGMTYDNILLDFLVQMDEQYRTDGRRAIGGISRGGFWAYHLGLRFPEQFVAIGGHSPFFDPYHAPSEFNPIDLALNLPSDTHLQLWLDRGTDDYVADGVDRMHINLDRVNVPHEYKVYQDDEHNELAWSQHIPDYVAFYASAFTVDDHEVTDTDPPDGVALWMPAGSFATFRTSITRDALDGVLRGELDEQLVLSHTAFATLTSRGARFHADTNVQPDEQLESFLWQDKNRYTLMPFDALTMRYRPLWVDDMPVVDQLDDYPLVWASDTPNYVAQHLTRLTLSGTTALARNTLTALDAVGLDYATSGIQDYVLLSDYFHVTNEASIAPLCPQFTADVLGGTNSMCMKAEHAPLFDMLDVDIVDLTGNHVNDYGYRAFDQTLDYFESLGIQTVGGGRTLDEARTPLILEKNGTRIGWVACNYIGPYYALVNEDDELLGGVRPGGARCDEQWLRDTLILLSAEVDVTVVTLQYQEYEGYIPQPQQQIDYQTIADWGADVVIGTAEHKPMTFEYYPTRRGETAFIHYGLGNLFFDQMFWGNMRFFMDTLYVYDGRLLTIELFPGIIDEQVRPRLMTADEQFNFLYFLFVEQNGF
jgi:poly-gamma-glutamate synthesis protein (capsule biosynthesis protein)